MGAGAAVNNTLRQVGSVLGVALLGTVLANAYQRGIAPALAGLPSAGRGRGPPVGRGDPARRRVARPARTWSPRPTGAFIHAMHVTAVCAAVIMLLGAILLVTAFTAGRRVAVAEDREQVALEPDPAVRR